MYDGAPAATRFVLGETLKRCLDICAAVILLIVFAPVIMLLALVTKTDGGPGFYGHRRLGRNGVPFNCWKLRTMVMGADQCLSEYLRYHPESQVEWAREQKLRFDPRITPIGRFLRKTSLDELPQLWNVIVGDMSLVGPRPVTEVEMRDRYGPHASYVLSVRPGLTGLWQVSGRSDIRYEERVRLDTQYVTSWRFTTDIAILLKTTRMVLTRAGSH